jgi:hypothetical protein
VLTDADRAEAERLLTAEAPELESPPEPQFFAGRTPARTSA